ncbi:MAG: peptide chain release factor N(5)-glutamine methyltransferase [Clostridia bacterium]|nr:peptide chain release factor N(5)-glutamine methyltransferase [Clostridia bacterium]
MVTRRDLFLRARIAIPEDNAAFEARELLFKALGIKKEDYYLSPASPVTEEDEKAFFILLDRRLKGEPLAHILGEWDFYGRTFRVTKDVLIPRPETEELCSTALKFLKPGDRVLDLCSGSGCIGITLALECPGIFVTMGEISDAAKAISEENIRLLKAKNITVRHEDALLPPLDPEERFDLIVSNPPYIGLHESLSGDVSDYEPSLALFGGEDGLDFYRAITQYRLPTLTKGGHLLFECGEKQARSVSALLYNAGAKNTHTLYDLSGKARVVIAE